MRTTKALITLGLILALLAPVSAFAQSAGDQQYVDPFQNQGGNTSKKNSGQGNSGAQNQTGTTTTPPTGTNTGQAAGTTASGNGTLPRTGLSFGWPALTGVFLLASGGTLRRVTLRRRA